MAIRPIEILINARDNASGVFDSLNNKLKVVGAAVAGYFGIKAFVGIVEGAADFEAALSRVQAATGASAEEMERLKKAAEDAGANTKFTSTEAAAALENLAKAGLSAGDAIETLPAVLALAQAGDIELATSAEYVTKAVMGMGLAFSDAGRVADVLAMGANATNTSVEGLAQALSYAAPTAASLGVSLEGTVAIIGKFADAGIDASRAGTALNSIMSQFSDPASKFKKELGEIGITTGDFETALKQLAESGARGSQAINAVGLEAGPALKALLNQGMPALTELKAKLEGAAGSAAATAKVMENNLKGSMTGLASAWDTVKNVLGTPVLPVLKDAVDQLAGAFRSAVSDGTIAKFGEAIAAGFQAGIKWAKEFLAQVDFTQLAADLRAFADRTGEAFAQLGEYARNAGDIVKTAYGVMSAGTNAVLTAIYGIGSGFAEVANTIMQGVAKLRDGLATVTFGGLSDSFKLAADDARLAAEGFAQAAQAMRDKAADAFEDTASSAQLARDGFAGLTSAVEDTSGKLTGLTGGAESAGNGFTKLAAAATAAKKALEDQAAAQAEASKELEIGAKAAAAAGVAYQKKVQAEEAAAKVAEEHAQKIRELSKEYQALLDAGDINQAIIVYDELSKAQRGIFKSSDDLTVKQKELTQAQKDQTEQIKALQAEYAALHAAGNVNQAVIVFDELVKTQRALAESTGAVAGALAQSSQQIEANAKAAVAYSSIADAGLRLELAKEKAYEATAKAAGNEAAQLQSKIKQKEIEIKIVEATAKAMEVEAATSIRVAEAKITEAKAAGTLTPELQAELTSRINLAKAKQLDAKATAASVDGLRAEITMLQNGTAARDKSTAAIDKNRTALEKLNDEKEREIAAQEKSLDLATRNLKLQEAKRTAGTIQGADAVPTFNSTEEAEAWKKQWMAQYQKDNPFSTKRGGQLGSFMFDMTMFEYKKELEALALRDAMKNAAPAGGRSTSSTQTPNAGPSTTTVNITVEGTTRSINTDAQGAATLQELVRQLAQAKGTASVR